MNARGLAILLVGLMLAIVAGCKREEAAPPPQPVIEYHAEPLASVSGRIDLDPHLDPFGVTVYAEGTSHLAVTDSKGSYQISGLPTGKYLLRAMRWDLMPVEVAAVEVTPGDLTKEQPFREIDRARMEEREGAEGGGPSTRTGTIRGTILTLVPSDAASIRVALAGTDLVTVTDQGGNFTLYGVPEGTQTLRIARQGYKTVSPQAKVEAGKEVGLPPIELEPIDVASIVGRTVFGVVEMLDERGNPTAEFSSVTVNLEGNSARASLDASGAFSIANLPAGEFVVSATAPGYKLTEAITVNLNDIESVQVALQLVREGSGSPPTGLVTGRIIVPDPPASGNSGVAVSLAGTSDIATTDRDGAFLLRDVPEGDYELLAVLAGYETAVVEDVVVVAGETTDIGELTLEQSVVRPTVIATSPGDGESDVSIVDPMPVVIQFSQEMDAATLADSIRVSPEVDYEVATAGEHELAGEDRVVLLLAGWAPRGGKPVRFGTRYRVEVDGTAANADGVAMKDPYSFSFTTGRAKIVGTWPDNGATGYVSLNSPMRVRFNARVSASKFSRDQIRIRPQPPTQPEFYLEEDPTTGWSTMSISGTFNHDEEYSVTIGRGLETIAGDRISNIPYTFKWRMVERREGRVGPQQQDESERRREERERR